MGRRGPKPTPTKTLQLRGSWRAKTRKAEPKPETEVPSAPSWLKGYAKREWGRLVKEFAKLDMLTGLDRTVLAMHCQALGDMVHYAKIEEREGSVIVSEKGGMYPHPAANLKANAATRAMKFGAELGLSPSSRTRINIEPKKAPDKLEAFLKKGAG
jgi:P27 family predicted phage terminase small subunit